MNLDIRIKAIRQWLDREYSYTEPGSPDEDIMLRAINEMCFDLQAKGEDEIIHFLCVQSPFYSGITELVTKIPLEKLRSDRLVENEKFSNDVIERLKWDVAKAYCLEQIYDDACSLHYAGDDEESYSILYQLANEGHYYSCIHIIRKELIDNQCLSVPPMLHELLKRRPKQTVDIFWKMLSYWLEADDRYFYGLKYYEYFLVAAETGYVDAMILMGDLHYHGLIAECSFLHAQEWYDKAAQNGNDEGKYRAGICKLFRANTLSRDDADDMQSWNEGIKLLQDSKDGRAAPMLYYAKHQLQHHEVPKTLTITELYELLMQEDGNNQYLYRGQTRVYSSPLRPSAYRPCRYSRFGMMGEQACQLRNWGREFYLEDLNFDQLKAGKKEAQAVKRIMSMYVNNALGYPLTQAFFQQAGYSSEGLDVSYDVKIALFFALYEYKAGSYFRKTSKEPSVLYRWKCPNEKMTIYDNYYSKAHFISTIDILNGFQVCDTVEESIDSLERYLEEIRWGKSDFKIPQKRPFELIKLPKGSLKNSRIVVQKAGLLIPDVIQGYTEQQSHEMWGYAIDKKTNMEYKLVQDLADPSICDCYYIDCSELRDPDFDIFASLPSPEKIYDDSQEDITHVLTHNIFERAFQEYQKRGIVYIETNPAMPGYQMSYQRAIEWLNVWNKDRKSCQYYFGNN